MRISSIALILTLTACNHSAVNEQATALPESDRVACAYPGASIAKDCVVEREQLSGATLLILRHRDGGFRRMLLSDEGYLAAADGGEQATVRQQGRSRDVTIGGERYILPIDDQKNRRFS